MLDALTLDQIRMFVTVAEAGSFRAGAARLLRAQSAVSHAIANLENQLGVAVFDRSGHRPTLTAAGAALLEDARAVLLKVDFLRARARGLGEGVETELALMVDTLYPLPLAAAALGELRAALPSVRLRLATAPLGGTLQALRDEACDLAIMAGEDFRDPRIETEALQAVPIVAVAARAHPLAQRRTKTLAGADLADHLQIVLEDPSDLSEGRDFGVLSPQTLRVGTQDAKRALILAGVGWGRLPQWAVERELAEGHLLPLPATALGPQGVAQTQTYLAWRTDRALGVAALALREVLHRLAAAPVARVRRRVPGESPVGAGAKAA
ncbi:LysR family transcriptional regulator [Acidovorax sp. Root219]|uniref:LysR family transcriptional regulator n=1 Tax=Acidovorax sp. Root219 TaxID=1736493 RepID=UPI00070E881C|nr:LysR family transcriptional regulator [Acidovorax sp. Root219]KRC18013.1 LysR family transcriptional regulator [Acidovorax sp. Root219]